VRVLPLERVVSPVPVFDASTLGLLRWVSERYVSPLAAVIARAAPPRVASEEEAADGARARPARPVAPGPASSALPAYRGGGALLRALADPGDPRPEAFALRPAPEDEAAVCVEAVAACLGSGRRALVLVPEADPTPATARAVLGAFGRRAVAYLGGGRRERYRAWLSAASGAHDVVVATRPGVFVPIADLGLVYVSRESHPALREDRAPYYHVRDVALERARLEGAVVVLEALCPSAETAALGLARVEPPARRWPPVEVVRPGPEGRAPRLVQALRSARRGFVLASTPGYGVARVCRSCGEPAACAACGGLLRLAAGEVRCVVCDARGRCASCGGSSFGVRRGGAERVEEWAAPLASVPVRAVDRPRLPGAGEILVGGPDDVHDLGVGGLDLVAVLDADRAGRRPGLASSERALATWFEAVGWARPTGRAIVQASDPADPAVQALVRGNADRFHERERARRADAGFPVGAAVFRVVGGAALAERLGALDPITLLASETAGRTVCLLALEPGRVRPFGRAMRELAADGTVERVEAEPHL
jgi:primosomal protein N' (replication factor Y)